MEVEACQVNGAAEPGVDQQEDTSVMIASSLAEAVDEASDPQGGFNVGAEADEAALLGDLEQVPDDGQPAPSEDILPGDEDRLLDMEEGASQQTKKEATDCTVPDEVKEDQLDGESELDKVTSEMEASSTSVVANTEGAPQEEEKDSACTEPLAETALTLEGCMDRDLVPDPPSPESVPVLAPFTAEDTIRMDTSVERQMDEDISLVVHADESQMDLDIDLLMSGKATPVPAEGDSQPATDGGTVNPEAVEPTVEGAATATEPQPTGEASADPKAADSTDGKKEGDAAPAAESSGATPAAADASAATAQKTDSQSKDGAKPKSSDSATKTNTKTAAGDKAKSAPVGIRNLWISGLASTTRATDLKTLFSKYGKVAGAKVVTNAKSPGSRCYGFVTMATAQWASKCIQHLHRTELHGKMISVERAKSDPSAQAKVAPKATTTATAKPEEKEKTATDKDKKEKTEENPKKEEEKDKERKRPLPPRERHPPARDGRGYHSSRPYGRSEGAPHHRGRSGSSSRRDTVLNFEEIMEERERERLRQRERALREEERRSMKELERQRQRQHEIESRQREEAIQLEREKHKLRMEQQRIERMRLDAERERIAMERERQKRERERLEREREEARQAQIRRDQEQRRNLKRNIDSRPTSQREEGGYWHEPKRANQDGLRNSRYDDRNTSGDGYNERRVERYDRRDGRALETGGRNQDRSYDDRRDDRRDSRREPATQRREDDRRGSDSRGGRTDSRYEDRRDTNSAGHDRNRHDRDRSPHHQRAPARDPPTTHRPSDTRNDWKNERTSLQSRDSRDGRTTTATERPYTDTRTAASRDGGATQSTLDHTWQPPERNSQSTSQLSARPAERSWTGNTSTNTDRGVGVRPQTTTLPVQQPLLQTPSSSAAFLASAANIMMGVGLGNNRTAQQDVRYDAYKNLQGGTARRY